MQAETNQHALVRPTESPRDRDPEEFEKDNTAAPHGYLLANEKSSDSNDATIVPVLETQLRGESEASCSPSSGRSSETGEVLQEKPAYDSKSEILPHDYNQQVLYQSQTDGHSYGGEQVRYGQNDSYALYPDAHTYTVNAGGQYGFPPVSQVQPNGWPWIRQGAPYPGCESHVYPHGYFIMPCYSGSSYPYVHSYASGVKSPITPNADLVYADSLPFTEQSPSNPVGYSNIEHSRGLPRPLGGVSTTSVGANYIYTENNPGRTQGLPPIWPSFAEKAPTPLPSKDFNGNDQYTEGQVNERSVPDVQDHQPSTYMYLPSNECSPLSPESLGKVPAPRKRPRRNISRGKATLSEDGVLSTSSHVQVSRGGGLISECKWLVPGEAPGKEQACDGHFHSAMELAKHISSDHVYRSDHHTAYVCLWEGCSRQNRPFKARYKLINHLRVHTGERPYKCQYPGCERTFARTENLKIHARGHSGERPYPCNYPGCEKKFSNSSDRKKHQRSHEVRI